METTVTDKKKYGQTTSVDQRRLLVDRLYQEHCNEFASSGFAARFLKASTNVNESARLYKSHYENPWNEEIEQGHRNHDRWMDSWQGRLAIRTFSRGLLGAAFMTAGDLAMRGYDPYLIEKELANPGTYKEVTKVHKGLARVAKAIDFGIGRPIKAVVRAFAGEEAALRAVTFRESSTFSAEALREANAEFWKEMANVNRSNTAIASTRLKLDEFAATAQTARGEEANRFYDESFQYVQENLEHLIFPHVTHPYLYGRTLGDEAVRVTFSFALGSGGDAIGREIVANLDPNVRHDWVENGRINYTRLAEHAAHVAWNIVTYNAGEDLFAGVPYVYTMKLLNRKALPYFAPGAEVALDTQLTNFSINDQGHVTGDYTATRAVDFQVRFMLYNYLTLMFRDVYNQASNFFGEHDKAGHIADMVSHWGTHPVETTLHSASETGKYLAKSLIKSVIYMAPSVPFFWCSRVPQRQYFAGFTGTEHGGITDAPTMVIDSIGPTEYNPFRVTTAGSAPGAHYMTKSINKGDILNNRPTQAFLGTVRMPQYEALESVAYSRYKTSPFQKMLSPISSFNERAGDVLADIADKVMLKPEARRSVGGLELEDYKGPFRFMFEKAGIGKNYYRVNRMPRASARDFFGNSFSYGPYMFMKAEFANLWDTPQMDASIYRLLDGAAVLNPEEVKAGLRDIGRVVLRQPVSRETFELSMEKRGPLNSNQLAHDSSVRHDYHEKGFYDKVKMVHQQATEPGLQRDLQPISELPPQPQMQSQSVDGHSYTDYPDTTIYKPENEHDYDLSKVNSKDRAIPTGATIH